MGEVRGGGSYLSQNDLRIHFGLGAAAKIDTVEIRWPSGKIENVTADAIYTIVEGAGILDLKPLPLPGNPVTIGAARREPELLERIRLACWKGLKHSN